GMTADRHSGGSELFSQIGAPSCVFTDLKECRLGAVVLQRLEHHRRVSRPGTVVEGQSDFLIAQEIILFEILGSECGATGCIAFNDSREAECVRIVGRSKWRGCWRVSWKSCRYCRRVVLRDCGRSKRCRGLHSLAQVKRSFVVLS